jgi:hypothetical protein
MNERKRLEKAAIRAHAAGTSWADFWPTVAAEVSALEPWNNAAFNKIATRLLLLVVSGDWRSKATPAAAEGQPEPWERDDQALAVPVLAAGDTETDGDLPGGEARGGRLARLLALPGVTTAAEIVTTQLKKRSKRQPSQLVGNRAGIDGFSK